MDKASKEIGDDLDRRYLDCAQILPGDVLLTGLKGLPGAVIKAATNGPFSHAAIILNNSAILEARTDGSGHTLLFRNRVEAANEHHGARLLHLLPENVTIARVLRKPGFAATLDGNKIDLEKLTRQFLWAEYAELAALAQTLDNPTLQKWAAPILRAVEKAKGARPEKPGRFCSELVAAIYEALDAPLRPDSPPETFSPNSFLELGFETVEGAVTRIDPDAEDRPDLVELLNLPLKLAFDRDLLSDLVRFQNRVRDLRERRDTAEKAKPNQEPTTGMP